jgi:hypothetical protein
MKEAAESLIAQLHSQGTITTQRHRNRKIRHEIKILKANVHALYVFVGPLELHQKHKTKSRETIPLNLMNPLMTLSMPCILMTMSL